VTGVDGLVLYNVGADEACVGLLNELFTPVLPLRVGGLAVLMVALSSGFLNVPGVVVGVVFGVILALVSGGLLNAVVALLFDLSPKVGLDVTADLVEVVVLVVLGLLNACEEDVVVLVIFLSSVL